jgi:hypothetical protein
MEVSQGAQTSNQGLGDFWAQTAKIHPFTTSTGFSRILPVANLLPLIWTGQFLYIFFKFWLISYSLSWQLAKNLDIDK